MISSFSTNESRPGLSHLFLILYTYRLLCKPLMFTYRQKALGIGLCVLFRSQGQLKRLNCAIPPSDINFWIRSLSGTITRRKWFNWSAMHTCVKCILLYGLYRIRSHANKVVHRNKSRFLRTYRDDLRQKTPVVRCLLEFFVFVLVSSQGKPSRATSDEMWTVRYMP